MSDFDDNDDDDLGNEDESSVLKGLRKQVRENASAAKERDDLARELAFTKAGVPDSKAAAYFVKGYDGEMTSEAIRSAAVEAGFLEAPKEDTASDEEREAQERTLEASGGSTDDSTPPGYSEDLAAAKNQEEVLAVLAKYNVAVRGT